MVNFSPVKQEQRSFGQNNSVDFVEPFDGYVLHF